MPEAETEYNLYELHQANIAPVSRAIHFLHPGFTPDEVEKKADSHIRQEFRKSANKVLRRPSISIISAASLAGSLGLGWLTASAISQEFVDVAVLAGSATLFYVTMGIWGGLLSLSGRFLRKDIQKQTNNAVLSPKGWGSMKTYEKAQDRIDKFLNRTFIGAKPMPGG